MAGETCCRANSSALAKVRLTIFKMGLEGRVEVLLGRHVERWKSKIFFRVLVHEEGSNTAGGYT